VSSDAEYLLQELARVEQVAKDHEGVLPEQQIHADLHLDNFLASSESITGLLDFEFSAYDWRVMELCVGLTKYIAIEGIDIKALMMAFIQGYAKAGGRFTVREIQFVPDGIVVRILSNVIFFFGRACVAQPPQDKIETLIKKVEPYARRCRWVKLNREWLIQELQILKE